LQEQSFAVPYTLPSGRQVTLRGKFDAVVLFGRDIYLQENKTKGDIDEEGIGSTLTGNLQSMFYQVALRRSLIGPDSPDWNNAGLHVGASFDYLGTNSGKNPSAIKIGTTSPATYYHIPHTKGPAPKIKGTLYNVVRRPLSDRYAIRQRKDE